MTRRLVIAMTGLVAVVCLVLAVPLAIVVGNNARNAFVTDLQVDALTTAGTLSAVPVPQWSDVAQQVAAATGARVVVVDAREMLMVDSNGSSVGGAFSRPEIVQALRGNLASSVRASRTLGADLRFVTAPVIRDGAIVAAVRLSMPQTRVIEAVRETLLWLALFVAALLAAGALLAVLVARSLARPVLALAAVARVLPTDLLARADERSGPREVREAAHALNRTARILDGVLRRTQAVAAEASHHLKTPLTGVRLRLEAIEDLTGADIDQTPEAPPRDPGLPDDIAAQIREQAAAATTEVDRLTHRIDQVLALARSDAGAAGSAPPVLAKADAIAIIASRAAAAAGAMQSLGITLQCGGELIGLRETRSTRDVTELPRVIDELLANAGAYASSCVRIDVHDDSVRTDALLIRVRDDGPGVPPQDLERIFERFQRASSAVPGGSGLGLALVREASRRAGGDAVAREDDDLDGLCIAVTWPVRDQPTGRQPTSTHVGDEQEVSDGGIPSE